MNLLIEEANVTGFGVVEVEVVVKRANGAQLPHQPQHRATASSHPSQRIFTLDNKKSDRFLQETNVVKPAFSAVRRLVMAQSF